MSIAERNHILQILHARNCERTTINDIIEDLERSDIFEDQDVPNDEDLIEIEEKASIIFGSQTSAEKMKALLAVKKKNNDSETVKQIESFLTERERRISQIQQELIIRGIIPDGEPDEDYLEQDIIFRYGRTPLHEAIAMRDISLVKKYLREGKYLLHKDNNGNTPREMAYYEGFTEALLLFEIWGKRNAKKQKTKKSKN